ncbi:MAG: HD domain-containing protein, partial [Elusimicrobia bacterium]|nr:HD domain-containing protein [Elusimicrobiota bacterium]
MSPRRIRLGAEAREALRRVAALRREPVWLVGGAIRDAALGRAAPDLDLAGRDARGLAAKIAREFKGTLVTLDAENCVYRLVLPPARGRALKQIDVAELQGADITADLKRRDFTANAVALELPARLPPSLPESAFLDPRRGLADLAHGVLRCEEGRLFEEDPLRLLRAFRVSAQTGLELDAPTLALIRKHRRLIARPAGERVQSELLALLAVPGSSACLRAMDECGLLTALFEDLEPARRCAEDYYGPGGVLKHALDVCARLDFLLMRFAKIYPDLARAFDAHLAARAAGGAPWRAVLMLAALLHDVSKAETARTVDGRLRFFQHDTRGAERAGRILRALRFSREHVDAVAAIVRHHLRPGHLVASGGPVTDKAAYRFFRDLGTDAPGLLCVCWADHAGYMPETRLRRLLSAACGDPPRTDLSRIRPEESRKTVRHLQLVSLLLRRFFDQDRAPVPARLLDGREVMKHLKIPPGPRVGDILERLREAQAEGEVQDRAQALAFVARLK